METGTRETGEAGRHGAKVVRLPREWLGPRDELVPIPPPPAPDPAVDAILSASDFWSEGSAALQGVVQGEVSALRGPPRAASPDPETSRQRHRRRRALLGAGAAVLLVLAAIGSAMAAAGGSPRRGARREVAQGTARGISLSATPTDLQAAVAGWQPPRRAEHKVHRAAPPGTRKHSAGRLTHRTISARTGSTTTARAHSSTSGASSSTTSSTTTSGTAHSTSGTAHLAGSTSARPTDVTVDQLRSSPSAGTGLPAPGGPPPP